MSLQGDDRIWAEYRERQERWFKDDSCTRSLAFMAKARQRNTVSSPDRGGGGRWW
jgi:hypothetical protein